MVDLSLEVCGNQGVNIRVMTTCIRMEFIVCRVFIYIGFYFYRVGEGYFVYMYWGVFWVGYWWF